MWFVELISRTELERSIFAAGHSIWIGGAMGLLLWVCLRLIPARYAGLRYAMTLGALLLLVVSLPAAYTVLSRTGGMAPAAVTISGQTQASAVPIIVAPAIPEVHGRPDAAEVHTDWVQIAALLWAAGFVAMLIRMAVQLRGTRRLLDGAHDASQTPAGQTVGRLLQRLQWRTPLRVLLTPQLTSPAVLGIFRPVLLLPPAIACELTPQQLESILLHELAHIRRYDYLVNIGQLLIEALLFFNPAVWLISRQVRIEREACCDAFAARITGEPLRYAEVLGAVMGRLRHSSEAVGMSMAARGEGAGHALDRVRRLLVPGYRPGLRLSGPMLAGAVIAGLLLLACLWEATGMAVAVGAEMGSKATGTVTVAGGDAGGKVQVCVETRILTIAANRLPPELYDSAKKQWRSTLLDDEQVKALVRSSQADQEGGVVTAPRVTVDDGGDASVDVTTPHQYRDVKATTRPDGTQEYSPTLSDTWDGIRQNITAKTDAGHQVTSIKFQLTIQKLLGMEKVQTKPTNPKDKPIEFELPQLQTTHIDTNITVPSGKTALLGGQEIAVECEGRGMVDVVLAVLVKPVIIIGDPPPAVPLSQTGNVSAGTVALSQVAPEGATTRPAAAVGGSAAVAAESSTTRPSGEDTGKVDPGIIAADSPGEGEYYVGGEVARVGVYSLSGRQITLKQAVVSAGIDNKTILPGAKVDLIRRLPGDKERITTIDLDAVFKGTQPDRYLQPNDILQVRTSPPATAPAQPTTSSTIQPVGSGKMSPGIIAADNPGDIGEYYMGGDVARGGVYSLTARQITLKQAVVSAGGLDTKTPAGRQALLIRRQPGNKESFSTVDVAAIFKGTQPDYFLQPYDLLIVQSAPQAPASAQPTSSSAIRPVGSGKITLDIIPADSPGDGEYYMGGHVKRVGVYSLTARQITLKQALVSAGGLDAKIPADMQTLLIRRLPGDKERITPIDLEALFQGTQPDRYLQPNDVLQVGIRPPATAPASAALPSTRSVAAGEMGSNAPGTATIAGGDAGGKVQVCVETRILTIEKKLLPPGIYDPVKKQWRSDFLDDEQVSALVRSTQADQGGSVVTAPRITVDDGGEASIGVTSPHQYRDVSATTRPDGSQEYSPTVKDTWDGIRENITARTDADHKVVGIKFRLTIQKVWGMDKVQTKPTHPDDKPIEFELPRQDTFDINTDLAVPSGKTALAGGEIRAVADTQAPLRSTIMDRFLGRLEPVGDGKGHVTECALIVLVKPTIIIGDPSTQPAVPLPQKEMEHR